MSMKIYTKTGDDGHTGLFGGKRVPKYADRIEAYGTVDELNSYLGLLNDHIEDETIHQFLLEQQHHLFNLGSVLACDPESNFQMNGIEKSDVFHIEQQIDQMQEQLPKLKNFILPGGHVSISLAHVCRTVCRRAERRVVGLNEKESVDPINLLYLNRLSDYFFVLARYLGMKKNIPETKWESK